LVDRAIHGFEAGVRNLWASFRRGRRPPNRRGSADDDWLMPIDLGSLGGPIPDIEGEPMGLSPPRPRRRPEPRALRAEPAAPRGEPASRPGPTSRPGPVLRPDPAAKRSDLRAELQVLRPEPQVAREPGPRPAAGPRPRLQAIRPDPASARPDSLAAHGLDKSFSGRKVVNGVSIHVRRGEAVGLLGPNGAGKTTVFYMITGLIKADRGRIDLDGQDVTRLPMYQRARLGVGYLPQEASIFRGLNVEDNIRSVL
jgi:lipopolysaccharide export system ATP-binding protein